MTQRKVTFLPDRRTSLFDDGISLRDAALELGLVIESSCAGIGDCGECRVQVEGNVTPPSSTELALLSDEEIARGIRLSCQALIEGDCTTTILPGSRYTGEQILEDGRKGGFPLDPDCRKQCLEVSPPVLGRKYFDLEAMQLSLGRTTGLPVDLDLLRSLPSALRTAGFRVSAVLDGAALLAVEPGDTTSRLCGIAVDIGTTTVVAKLIDLITGDVLAVSSGLNAQESYGADVISRVKYTIEHEGGLSILHHLILDQLNQLVEEVCAKSGREKTEIYKAVIVGNTIMQHLAVSVDPRHLAAAPYTPGFRGPLSVEARALGLGINPFGTVYFMPNLACYVGSDITAVLTVLDLEHSDDVQLVVDIGTNGETVLGSRRGLLCCSSPAGPAWEGASISWGMRATHGAIERVDLSGGDLVCRTIGNLPPAGLCGSGLMDLIALLVRSGLVDSTGRMLGPEEAGTAGCLASRLVPYPAGLAFQVAPAVADSWIEITQRDVRELQLAKSAIASAINILMKELGITAQDISRVHVAGAFGNHIRGQDAIDIGLLPPVPPERIHFIGNAAVAGAEAVLTSRQARKKSEQLAELVQYVELAGRPDFQEEFASSLLFPEL